MKLSLAEKLYERYNESDRNFLISPYSIHMALAMAKEGARGVTLEEMEEVLGEDPKFIDAETLKIANAIWLRAIAEQAWIETIQTKYRGESRDIQGTTNPELLINNWVSQKTQGKITKILESGQLRPDDRLIITNAIHFKDDWMNQFKEEYTKRDPFYAPGATVTVDMMHGTKKVLYLETDTFQAIQLRYKHGFHMGVVLPKSRTGTVSLEDFQRARRGYHMFEEVEISLPRFTMEMSYSLKSALMEMGMPRAFSDIADFNGITKDVKINDVLHKTFIDVDEEGTEAAAVTAVTVMTLSAAMPKPPIVFRADHPFTFYIWDRSLGTVLFMGALKRP